MNTFEQLAKIYREIDTVYASVEMDARFRGHGKKETEYKNRRLHNDQAYFLYMFTRLEDRVGELTDKLINKNKSRITNKKLTRLLELIQQRNRSGLYFLDRVSILTQRGERDFNLIKEYYEQRNKIAHGGTFTVTISIETVIADMNRLYKDLA